MTSQTFQEFSC